MYLPEIYTGELPEPKPMVTEDNSVFNSNYCDDVTTDNEVPLLPPDPSAPPVPPKLFDFSVSPVPPQILDPSAPPVPPKLVDFSASPVPPQILDPSAPPLPPKLF